MTKATKSDTLYCNFCGKSQHDVVKLIAGPTIFICDECVDMCYAIVHEDNVPRAAPGAEAGRPFRTVEWVNVLDTTLADLTALRLALKQTLPEPQDSSQ